MKLKSIVNNYFVKPVAIATTVFTVGCSQEPIKKDYYIIGDLAGQTNTTMNHYLENLGTVLPFKNSPIYSIDFNKNDSLDYSYDLNRKNHVNDSELRASNSDTLRYIGTKKNVLKGTLTDSELIITSDNDKNLVILEKEKIGGKWLTRDSAAYALDLNSEAQASINKLKNGKVVATYVQSSGLKSNGAYNLNILDSETKKVIGKINNFLVSQNNSDSFSSYIKKSRDAIAQNVKLPKMPSARQMFRAVKV